MSQPLLRIEGLRKSFGALAATNDFSLDIPTGETHALIGPNGAGKTTLIAQISGELRPDAGSIQFAGEDITALTIAQRVERGISRSFQISSILPEFTVLQNVAIAVQATEGHSFRFHGDPWRDPRVQDPALRCLEAVQLASKAHVIASELAHGEQRQLELAMALALKPRLVLLDEPTAGMAQEDARRIQALLRRLKTGLTMLLVEHDMDLVFALSDRVTVMVYGKAVSSGPPEQVRADPVVREAYLGDFP